MASTDSQASATLGRYQIQQDDAGHGRHEDADHRDGAGVEQGIEGFGKDRADCTVE
jgi:hypothetical protein